MNATQRAVRPVLICTVAAVLAAAPGAASAARSADPEAQTPSIRDTLAAVTEISRELKRIDARLGQLEQSLAGVNASLEPVGAIARPAALRELILLATACGAGLIVLHAMLRRWVGRTVASTSTNA